MKRHPSSRRLVATTVVALLALGLWAWSPWLARTVERILKHLGLPTEVPVPRPARARPHQREPSALGCDDEPAAADATF